MPSRIIAKKAFQDILRQMRSINRKTETVGSKACFLIEKDSIGGYTVTVPQTGKTILKGMPGSKGYLTTYDAGIFVTD